MKLQHIAVPFVIALAGGVALSESLKLPFGLVSAPAPGFFPTVLAALLVICALAVCWQCVVDKGESPSVSSGRKRTILTVLLLIGFACFIELLGYLITTITFIFLLLWIVERKTLALSFLVAVSAAVISYAVFKLLLGAPLPTGLLG